MRHKRWLLFIFAILCSQVACAQIRWCPMAFSLKVNTIAYPPIARAAHVSGNVIGRVEFLPGGPVIGFHSVSGPAMLSKALEQQAQHWKVTTSANGVKPCQSLIVVAFTLGEKNSPFGTAVSTPDIDRIWVNTEALVISDPAFTVTRTKRSWFRKHKALDD